LIVVDPYGNFAYADECTQIEMNYGQSRRFLFKSVSRRSSTHMAKKLLGATLALGLPVAQVGASPNSWLEIMLLGDVPGRRGWHGATSARGLMYVYAGVGYGKRFAHIDQA